MKEIELVKLYEFDGTSEGYKLLRTRLPNENASFNGKIAMLKNGLYLQKGDHYQVREQEEFKAIG
jgi:hypothetical protein